MGDSDEAALSQRLVATRFGRRSALRGAVVGVGGLAAAVLIGCDDDDDDDGGGATGTATATTTATSGATGTATPAGASTEHPDGDYVAQAEADNAPFPYNYPEPATQPKPGGRLVVGHPGANATWDPTKSQAVDASRVPNTVYDRLLTLRSGPMMSKYKVDLEPSLAKSWEVTPDGLTYAFDLRDDVNFQNIAPVNGRPFTANDVVAAYQRNAAEGVNRAFFADVAEISAPSDHALQITLTAPTPDFLIPLAMRFSVIYPIELVEGDQIATTAIGTGPLIISEVSDNGLKYDANPEYWGGKPYMDGFEFQFIPDAAGRVAAYRAGQIQAGPLIDNKAEGDALLASNPDTVILCDPIVQGNAGAIVFNIQDNPLFQDERIRRALSMALDRDAMAQILFDGYAKTVPVHGWPFLFERPPTAEQLGQWWQHNPTEAKKLLDAAGQGTFEFGINALSAPTFEVIADQYRAIDVTMRIEPTDRTQLAELRANKTYKDAIHMPTAGALPTADGSYYHYVHSTLNAWQINDPQLDEWAELQHRELDPDARKEYWQQEWDLIQDQAFKIELPFGYYLWAADSKLRHYRFNGPYVTVHFAYDYGMMFAKGWWDS
jgi:ABC-type transport system substrate-binding protein